MHKKIYVQNIIVLNNTYFKFIEIDSEIVF